jgi:hypothetical protein
MVHGLHTLWPARRKKRIELRDYPQLLSWGVRAQPLARGLGKSQIFSNASIFVLR